MSTLTRTAEHWLRLAATAVLLAGCGGNEPAEPDHPGKAVYLRYCFSCHQAGIAGAPKFGDRKKWARRIAQGEDVMLENVIRGMTPGMPPRGACPSCDDETLAVAVDYMIVNAR